MTTLEREPHEKTAEIARELPRFTRNTGMPAPLLDDALAPREKPGWNIARIFAVLILLTMLMAGVLKLLTMKA